MKHKTLFWLTSLIAGLGLTAPSYSFFCPTNFSQIDTGMSLAQVIATCGKPEIQKESKKVLDNTPQEWIYYLSDPYQPPLTNMPTGKLKLSVVFDGDGKVVSMNVNGVSTGMNNTCGRNVKIGDDRERVKAACGEAAFINKSSQTDSEMADNAVKVTEITYTNTNPPATLIFENGILTESRTQ